MREITPDGWLVYRFHDEYEYIPYYGDTQEAIDSLERDAELMEICGTKDAAIRSRNACYKLYKAEDNYAISDGSH